MKKRILLLCAALCLLLSGCGGGLLEREWSSVTPHSAGYWENGDKDTLRADSYQDAVNAILMLVANHAERGVVRCYFGSDAEYAELAAEACNEVQQETDLGAYLLDYITFASTITANLNFDQKLDFITQGLGFHAMFSFKNWSSTSNYRYMNYNLYSMQSYTKNDDGTYSYTTTPVGDPTQPVLSNAGSSTGDRRYYGQLYFDYNRTGPGSPTITPLFELTVLSIHDLGHSLRLAH